jgi:putative membrane protein insertion efficiency factor/ribonuclease P protein component
VANKPKQLKRSSEYKQASLAGKKIKLAPWVHLHILSSEDGFSYYGMTASRKVGSAVVRNRLKRWVRNCVRTEKWPDQFINKKVVFVFRAQTNELFFKEIKYSEFLQLYKKFDINILVKSMIVFYQKTLSYFLGGNCRYYPTCSHYAVEAFEKHRFTAALKLVSCRILSCHPFSKKNYYDPVPMNIYKCTSNHIIEAFNEFTK